MAAEGKGLGQIFAGVVVDDHVAKLFDFAEICPRANDAAFFGFLKDVEKGARFLKFKCYQGAEGFVNKKVGGAGESAHERFDTFAPEIFDWGILGQACAVFQGFLQVGGHALEIAQLVFQEFIRVCVVHKGTA